MKRLGLIAGSGELPMAVALEARSKGYTVIAIGLEPVADSSLSAHVDEIKWINVGKLGKIIETLKSFDIREAVMAGKVSKSLMFQGRITPDLRAIKVLFSLKDRSDDSILLAITKELEKDGIILLNTTDFSHQLLTPEGVLTVSAPSQSEWDDIAFGWEIAKEIGRLDIGQTIVVKDKAVMSVEAIEGTDAAITRGGELAGSGAVVVKVSKPQQDMRFDVPVVGLKTLHAMIEVRARILAVEAGNSILLNKKQMLLAAEDAGIAIVGYSHTQKSG